jgi:hypothetical protein
MGSAPVRVGLGRELGFHSIDPLEVEVEEAPEESVHEQEIRPAVREQRGAGFALLEACRQLGDVVAKRGDALTREVIALRPAPPLVPSGQQRRPHHRGRALRSDPFGDELERDFGLRLRPCGNVPLGRYAGVRFQVMPQVVPAVPLRCTRFPPSASIR